MTGFDFPFALFSLLLGLGIAEVLAGFAKVLRIEARARAGLGAQVRVGWLVPLLAVYLLLSQLTFFMVAFSVRETLPFNYVTLVAITLVVGGYYLFATLVFPDHPEDWPDFDDYYDQHNRFILAGMVVTTWVIVIISNVYPPAPTPEQLAARETPAAAIAAMALLVSQICGIAVVFVKGRRFNALLLAALISLNILMSLLVIRAGL